MSYLIAPVPIRDKAENLRDLSRLFEGLAICKLIVEADVAKFRDNLVRSAQARRYYLRKSHEEGNLDDRFLGLSRVQAIMDAVVADEMDVAGEIASLSIDEWHDGWEYEDDFCYFLFLHRVIVSADFFDGADAQGLLARFERIVDGQPSARLELCKALQRHDAREFRAAFEKLLAEYSAANDAKRARMTEYTADAIFWPESFVSIEALAWLRLGEMFGIAPSDDFALCPAEARDVKSSVAVPDLFESLDRALKQS